MKNFVSCAIQRRSFWTWNFHKFRASRKCWNVRKLHCWFRIPEFIYNLFQYLYTNSLRFYGFSNNITFIIFLNTTKCASIPSLSSSSICFFIIIFIKYTHPIIFFFQRTKKFVQRPPDHPTTGRGVKKLHLVHLIPILRLLNRA